MIDETNPNSVAIDAMDILGQDLTNQETTFPILEAGVVDVVISDAKLEPTKKQNGYMLNLRLKTTMPWKDKQGIVKAPGFPIRAGIYIPSGADVNPEAINMSKMKLAQLKESAFGTKEGAFGSPGQYIGRTVSVRVTITPPKDGREEQNDIGAFVKRT